MTTYEHIGTEYKKIKETYFKYVENYKKLNKGSAKGITTFAFFYIYRTYTNKYSDSKKLMSHVYK
jgi:hypothetical protein